MMKNEKVRALVADIIVTGTETKPYYEIKYYDLSDGRWHIGYGSYDLKNVFDWKKECFEIVWDPSHRLLMEQVKFLSDVSDKIKTNIDSLLDVFVSVNTSFHKLLDEKEEFDKSRYCNPEQTEIPE